MLRCLGRRKIILKEDLRCRNEWLIIIIKIINVNEVLKNIDDIKILIMFSL